MNCSFETKVTQITQLLDANPVAQPPSEKERDKIFKLFQEAAQSLRKEHEQLCILASKAADKKLITNHACSILHANPEKL